VRNIVAPSFRALRHRNYRLYWFGHLISSTGTWTQIVALSWLVYRLSRSPVLLGAVGFASMIPIFALAVLGGVAADRFSRRGVILVAQSAAMLQALTLAVLTLSGRIEIWHVFVFAFGIGAATAFDIPARQSFLVEIAGREDLMNAIALNSSAFQTARMLGPALAAFILASGADEGVCFLLNGLSYMIMIFALSAMGPTGHRALPGRSPNVTQELIAGIRFTWNNRTVRNLLFFIATTSFWGVSYIVLMPIFSAEVLGSGPDGLGILMSASGLGSIAGALFVATQASRGGPGSIRHMAAGCGLGLALSLIGFAASPVLWLSALLSAAAGAFLLALAATTNSCIQLLVPDELRGRTMSLYIAMYVGAYPFGHLFAGLLAGQTGVRAAVTLAGLLAIGTTLALARKLPARPPAPADVSTEGPWV
jgi:MFS family permease